MSFEESFLQDTIKRFTNYKDLGEKTFAQLEEKDFFFLASPESNSIAIITQHMHGNMLSRFTNFLTKDGEKSGSTGYFVVNSISKLVIWSSRSFSVLYWA